MDTTFVTFRLLKEFERRNNRLPVPKDEDVMVKLAESMLFENGLNKDFLPENDIASLCSEVRKCDIYIYICISLHNSHSPVTCIIHCHVFH